MNVIACDRCKTLIDKNAAINSLDRGVLFASAEYNITSRTNTPSGVVGTEIAHMDLCGKCGDLFLGFLHGEGMNTLPTPVPESEAQK